MSESDTLTHLVATVCFKNSVDNDKTSYPIQMDMLRSMNQCVSHVHTTHTVWRKTLASIKFGESLCRMYLNLATAQAHAAIACDVASLLSHVYVCVCLI